MDKIRLALVQHRVGGTDRRQTPKRRCISYAWQGSRGPTSCCSPECFLTGYQPPEIPTSLLPLSQIGDHPDFKDFCENALTPGSEPLRRVCQEAKALSIGAVITGFSRGGALPAQHRLSDREGREIALTYSKVHTCDFDWERYLESRGGLLRRRLLRVKIGLMICYDREVPRRVRESSCSRGPS